MKKALIILCLSLFAVGAPAVKPIEAAAQQKEKNLSSNTATINKMGWLFVDPRDKWGLPKVEALRVIKKETGMILEKLKDSPESTIFKGEFVLVIGEKMTYFAVSFACGFTSGNLSGLNVTWMSNEASMETISFLWDNLIDIARDNLDAPNSYVVSGYRTADIPFTKFGSDFKKGIQQYNMYWDHSNTSSSFTAYRMAPKPVSDQLHSVISLQHRAVKD
ncbi:hypothetical protein ACFLY1_00475 [Patescibacteria group bacterium]